MPNAIVCIVWNHFISGNLIQLGRDFYGKNTCTFQEDSLPLIQEGGQYSRYCREYCIKASESEGFQHPMTVILLLFTESVVPGRRETLHQR